MGRVRPVDQTLVCCGTGLLDPCMVDDRRPAGDGGHDAAADTLIPQDQTLSRCGGRCLLEAKVTQARVTALQQRHTIDDCIAV